MPLARYFFFVGAALLTLLFIIDAYVPKLPTVERVKAAADLSVIRIHSDRKWPERVVFDTSLPTITPVAARAAEASVPAPPVRVAEFPAKAGEAFAQLQSNPNQLQTADARKPEPRRKHKTVARSYFGPSTIRVAQQPRFGFFGNNIW
ncbi:MAG: hypothetical protein ACXWKP_12750 [Bradyrhizobium sp.]